MFKIAVLASTKGTDLQAIIDEIKEGKMEGIELSVVISDKRKAYALERARNQGFKAIWVKTKDRTREEFDKKVAEILDKHDVDLIVLIGFMRILSEWFINKYRNKIINVHPALIPKYCGANFFGTNVHQAILDAREKETGMTIHYLDEGVDTGPIIIQKTCPVFSDDTPEILKERVQELEKKWYPEVIRQLAKQKFN